MKNYIEPYSESVAVSTLSTYMEQSLYWVRCPCWGSMRGTSQDSGCCTQDAGTWIQNRGSWIAEAAMWQVALFTQLLNTKVNPF